MLYETMLKKLKKQRSSNKKGSNGVTALEVCFFFYSPRSLQLPTFYQFSILEAPFPNITQHHKIFFGYFDNYIAIFCQIFLLGALAKLGATVVTYPLLVVKVHEILLQQCSLYLQK